LIYFIPGPSSSINEDPSEQILNKLADSIASLFSNQDFKPVLRICRPFIRKRPELLHEAIRKNSSDLISNFISVAGIELLQEKNQLGETILLHAARLNRVNIVEAILRKENSDRLLEDTNNKGQNVFHILALNTDSDEILNLFINHLLKNLINISEKFDHVDENNQTPLQLAIKNNNLPARHLISKYFHNDIHDTIDHITDAVIQLTVFYDDLTKVK
jgi:ankyrin repeat protein